MVVFSLSVKIDYKGIEAKKVNNRQKGPNPRAPLGGSTLGFWPKPNLAQKLQTDPFLRKLIRAIGIPKKIYFYKYVYG